MIDVRYLNPPPWFVTVFGDDLGRVYFDTGDEFDADMTKALDRINEVQRISQEAALAKSLPDTTKNRALLDQFSGDVLERRKTPIDIEVTFKGERVPLTGAIASGYDPADGGLYEFEMFADDWIDKLEALPLSDVDAGTYEFTSANVVASWTNNNREMVKPVLASYGGFRTPGDVTRKDLRLWFNLGMLLEAAFCAVGWSFRCEHFEEADGRDVYGYLSGEDWANYTDKQTDNFVELEVTTPVVLPQFERIAPWEEVFDPLNLYNNTGIIPPGFDQYISPPFAPNEPGKLSIEVTGITVELPPSNANFPSYFGIVVDKNNNGSLEILDSIQFDGSETETTTLNVEFIVVDPDMTPGDRYSVTFFASNDYTLVKANLKFRPNLAYYGDDNIIPVADLIDPEISCLDLFSSLAHFINGKVETDVASRTVTLRPPYPYTAAKDENIRVEGFYVENIPPVDIRSRVVDGTTGWEAKDTERNRYRLFKFADPSDVVVESIDDGERANRRVDLGSGKSDTDDIENDLFGPTYSRIVSGDLIGGNGAYLPHLWDNDEGQVSTDVGYRVGVWYGEIEQTTPDGAGSFSFEGQVRNFIPYVSQFGVGLASGITRIPLSFSGSSRDLYQLFYFRETQVDDDGITYELSLTGGIETYELITFRRSLLIPGESSDLEVRPVAVKGYRWGSRDSMTLAAKILKC